MLAAPSAPKVVGASLFKNGYAIITREIPLINGTASIVEIPQSSLGTLWFSAPQGTTIEEITNTERGVTSETPASSFEDFLRINVGKEATLTTVNLGTVVGTIVAVQGDIITLRQGGKLQILSKGEIRRIEMEDGSKTSFSTTSTERVLKMNAKGPGPVYMVSLERGITWAPGYAIELKDDKNLTIVSKATVLDDLADLDDIEARFITGFPNVTFAGLPDPLTSGQSVDQFVGLINGIGSGPGGGGFRGGRAREMMSQNAAAPAADFGESMQIQSLPGMQTEELFFYRRPNVTLKKGDRAYYILFRADAPYERLYTWDVDDPIVNDIYNAPEQDQAEDVWQTIKFKDTANQPLTTAAASVFRDGAIIGQDMMRYTTAGAEASLRITKALDVRAKRSEEEIARQKLAVTIPGVGPFDLVTVKGTLSAQNLKSDAVTLRIRKSLTGEIVSADGNPKTTKMASGLRQTNPRSQLEWTVTIPSGKHVDLTYTYKVYVHV